MKVTSPMMWLLFMCYIFGHIIMSHNNGFVEAKSLPKFEDLEIEKILKTINKPAVKIIKTIDGELYGCVDFFKQPAFDHPSLQNHTYHYKMRRKTNHTEKGFGYLWENGVGCPIGTVPIKRVTKENLLRLNSLGEDYKPRGSWNSSYDQHHFAVARTKNLGMEFNGATMEACVAAPIVKPTQYSASRLHIQIGDDFIQTGVTVNPALFGDNQPRLFAFAKVGEKSCFNSQCDVGFICSSPDIPLGLVLQPVSHRGHKRSYYTTLALIKGKITGRWSLEFGSNGDEIGFWPTEHFSQSPHLVEWGGEVYSANLPSPQMGYGVFPFIHIRYDAYFKRISILDSNFNFDEKVDYLEDFSDDNGRYHVIDLVHSEFREAGHIIFYGGPGDT